MSGLDKYGESVHLFRELGDQAGLAIALNGYGSGKLNGGEYVQAGQPLEESLAIFRKMGNRLGMGNVLHELGRLKWFQRRPGDAQLLLDESLTLHRELGNRRGIALALFNLAGVQRALGNLPKSDELFREGLWPEGRVCDFLFLRCSAPQK